MSWGDDLSTGVDSRASLTLNRRFGSHHFRSANFPHARRRGPGCRSVGVSPASAHTLGQLLAVRRDIEVTRSRAFNWLTVTGTPHERCGRRQSNVGDIARGLLQVGGLRPNPGEQQDRGHLNHAAIDGHGLGPPAGELGRRGASGDHGRAVGQPSAHRRRVSGGRTGRTTAAPAAAREAGGSKGKRSHPSPAPAGDPRSVAPKGRLAPVRSTHSSPDAPIPGPSKSPYPDIEEAASCRVNNGQRGDVPGVPATYGSLTGLRQRTPICSGRARGEPRFAPTRPDALASQVRTTLPSSLSSWSQCLPGRPSTEWSANHCSEPQGSGRCRTGTDPAHVRAW